MPIWLIPAFLGTALLYASVGFGGGSTYNALLALAGVDYRVLPAIALTCNIIVVIGGTWRFHRAGLLPWRRALPLVLVSAPFAGLGGLTPITETAFLALLATSLFVAGLALLVQRERPLETAPAQQDRKTGFADLLTGAGVGYLAGLVGIGGGILLSPVLLMIRWTQQKQTAAISAAFIFVNSAAGLLGFVQQHTPWIIDSQKTGGVADAEMAGRCAFGDPWFAVVAILSVLILPVLLGGFFGSWYGAKKFDQTVMKYILCVVLLIAAIKLLLP